MRDSLSGVEAMASRFVSKIRHSTHRIGPFKVTAAVFKRCVLRWSSSSPEAQNTRTRMGDIRWLCKAGKTHEVPHLFHQLRDLPEKCLANSFDSALYWFLYYDKIEEALEFRSLLEKHVIPKTYSTYSSLAVLYSKCSQLGTMKDFFDEMTRDGLTPKVRHYAPFVEAAAEKGDLISAFDSMNEMQQSAVVHERNADLYTVLIRACAEQQNNGLTDKVLELFYDFRKYRDLLSNETLETVKLWFDR